MNRLMRLTVFLLVAIALTLPVFGQMGGGVKGGATGEGMMGGKARNDE